MSGAFRQTAARATTNRRTLVGILTNNIDDMPNLPIDPVDRALIALLRENARASTAELARRLGLSRTTVQSRMERLERQRVIGGL